ncbi:hypothetical protein JCM10908_001757 [Rhodotorula pacifica]|uniref:mitochondrial 37S ribosomal protein uS2m MRP4 n=1 Tax=Rhodotorula pacifica TaxID=1495444 RepID=UPI0031711AB9
MVRPPTSILAAATRATPRSATRAASSIASSSSSSSASPSSDLPSPATPASATSARQRAQQGAYDNMLQKVEQRRAARLTADVFERLGSTQTRDSTFQPHHSLYRPPSPAELTTSHLVAAGAHLGHARQHTHRSALPLVYGTRSGVAYIDLRQTLPALRRAAQVVKGVVERDGKVLFVGSLKGAEQAVWENAKRLGENGYGVTKWLPGTISNAKEVFGWSEIPSPAPSASSSSDAADSAGGRGGRRSSNAPAKLTPLSFKPDLLVLLSPTLNRHALREATQNQVPTIGIIDTDLDPRSVTYAIPANDDSPRAVELIAGVLGMAGKDGLRAKHERLVREAALYERRSSREY